ncbi:uncharacterized protein V1510DRAFT_374352 [Dipodascopsis tothii]|uniref:uncharacterized protein n=1 Tax=Dipodascopsis tothii TaxID=44089 RepID=UPI0034CEF430
MRLLSTAAVALMAGAAAASNVISTGTYYSCSDSDYLDVSEFYLSYDKTSQNVTFNIAGTTTESLNVTATLEVTAYGKQVFSYSFDPCDYGISELCPIPAISVSASGEVNVPSEYADKIPSIAFLIPDLDGAAKLVLTSDDNTTVACYESAISNGKTAKHTSVAVASAAIVGAALVASGVGALSSISSVGVVSAASALSVGLPEVMSWTQGLASNGMLSLSYPNVYSSFAQNFGWSVGLISWGTLETAIDDMRANTGGNTTVSSYAVLKNSTLVNSGSQAYLIGTADSSSGSTAAARLVRRLSIDGLDFSIGTGSSNSSSTILATLEGIARYSDNMSVPNTNIFMTALVFFGIVVGAIVFALVAFKLALDLVSRCVPLKKGLESFRHRCFLFTSSTVVRVMLIVYSTWAIFCCYQFRLHDSKVSLALAVATLGLFTAVVVAYTTRIFVVAHKASRMPGGIEELYEHKPYVRRYGLFYGQYKSKYWWFFVPVTVAAVARGVITGLADGHGLIQVASQLGIEGVLVLAMLIARPFNTRSGNVINLMISVTRTISFVLLLVFVEELGVQEETSTVVGIVLIVIQALLTVMLAIMVVINLLLMLFKKQAPKTLAAEKRVSEDLTELGPIDLFATKGGYMRSPTVADGESPAVPTKEKGGYLYQQARNQSSSMLAGNNIEMASLVAHGSRPGRAPRPWDDDEASLVSKDTEIAASASSSSRDHGQWVPPDGLELDHRGRPVF